MRSEGRIYKIVLDLAKRGAAILYYSTELDELLRLCHRVAVFHDGYVDQILEKTGPDGHSPRSRCLRTERGVSVVHLRPQPREVHASWCKPTSIPVRSSRRSCRSSF